jgi:hypothetical protein
MLVQFHFDFSFTGKIATNPRLEIVKGETEEASYVAS